MSYFDGRAFAFIDTETTGLDPYFHEVIEIGCVIATQELDLFGKPHLKEASAHEWKIIPEHIERAQEGALKTNRYRERDWSDALQGASALTEFAKVIEGKVIVAANVTFDWGFLTAMADRTKVQLGERPFYLKLDLGSIALGKLSATGSLDRFSLGAMAKHFNITETDKHTALADARTAFLICKKLLEE